MNCQIGDIAVITSSEMPENIGAIVCVKEAHPTQIGTWIVETLSRTKGFCALTMTVIDVPVGAVVSCGDRRLKPLRDGPGTDEVLRIAGLPLSKSHRDTQPRRQVEFTR